MDWSSDRKIMIIGLGQIGGSYAMGLTRLGFRVSALDRDPDSIAFALEQGIIQQGWTEPDPAVIGAMDVLIFALYPLAFRHWAEEYGRYIRPGTMVTDVTGVKSCVVYAVQDLLPRGVEFVPAHPMAGSERSGVRSSSDRVFRDANYIVTPTARNSPEGIEWCKGLGRVLGFHHIAVMSPEEHDSMIAFLSQLTHCIAVSLMTCNDDETLAAYTGNSFRDLTRIARINDRMWSELFLANREALLEHMDRFAAEFQGFRDLLAAGDVEGMREKMRLSTARRAKFDVPVRP